jgi:tetratricopeptide (TPR) repeat protein
MNTNLLSIVKQITAQYGEEVLGDARRLKALFSDLAKDEPKPLRMAFGKCVEGGFYRILKDTTTAEERREVIDRLARRLRDEEGLDLERCAEALELLAAAIFGTADAGAGPVCAGCGAELKANWKACPECGTPVRAAGVKAAPAVAPANKAASGAEAHIVRAKEYEGKRDDDAAIAEYTKAIELDPDNAEAYNRRGIAYGKKGDGDRAFAGFNRAIKLDPDYAEAYCNRGFAYYIKKDCGQAIADFNRAIKLDPDYAEAYCRRGYAYGKKGDYGQAITDINRAIELDPDYAWAYYGRADAYGEKGDYDQAIADYTQAIKLNPDYAAAYVSRGSAYLMYKKVVGKNDCNRAIADINRAIELDPDNASVYQRNLDIACAILQRIAVRGGK